MTTLNMEDDKTATPKKIDIIGRLPPELVEIILFYLTPEDLTSAVSCCLRWKAVISYNYFWNTLCLREAYPEVEESQRSEFYTNFFKKYNYWQAVYWYNYTLRKNWIKGHYQEVTFEITEPHNQLFWSFFDDILLVRNVDQKKFYVYNFKTTGFKRTVFSLSEEPQFGCERILKSGKYLTHFVKRKTLTVWDYENEIKVLEEFWYDVANVYAFQNLFVLEMQYDDTFQVFNIESRQIEYQTRGILLRDLIIMDGRMVFLTEDHYIHVVKWDDKSLVSLKCCSHARMGLHKFLVKSDLLLSFCKDDDNITNVRTSFCVWNITTETKLYSISLVDLYLYDVSFLNNYLYLSYIEGRADDGHLLGKFEVLDYTKGTVIASVTDLDTSVPISNDQIVVVYRSNKLSLWCLKTKSFVCDLDISLHYYVLRTNMVISKSKLFYALADSFDSLSLHVRDYEISDDEMEKFQ